MKNLEDPNEFIQYFNLSWVFPTRGNYNRLHIYKMTAWIDRDLCKCYSRTKLISSHRFYFTE